MTHLRSLPSAGPSLHGIPASELLGLLHRAEQSRIQVIAFIEQVDAELRQRQTGAAPPAA